MTDASSLGVTAASSVSGSFQLGYNLIQTSTASAINIGSLTENTSSLNVLSTISSQAPNDYYSFNFTSGDNIKLALNNLTNSTGLRVQLLDSAGNVVADSGGTAAQQTAYTNLTSSTGLTAGQGQYYVKVSYSDPSSVIAQSYNFQLYSGTTYNSTLTTTALTQPYDPNLFHTVASTVTAASNVTVYNRSATLAYSPTVATATSIGNLINNQTALNANGEVTQQVPVDDYSFNVNQNGPVKLSFDNVTNSSSLDVKILDSTGNIVADSQGTDVQKYAYQELTSGAGLNLTKGQYEVQVGFIKGDLTNVAQKYNFQLYAGNTYSSFYTTTAAVPSTATSNYQLGTNLNIYSSSDATEASRQQYNTIDATAAAAINIGWLQENKSALAVNSQLTTADNTDYYSFTFESGSALKLDLKNLTNSSPLDIQLLDSTGSQVIADNQGTKAQQAAFAQLTSDSGLKASNGQYVVKVSYGAGQDRSQTINYDMDLYSGTQYTAQYKTIASSETIGTFLFNGGKFGYTSNGAAATFLTSAENTSTTFV